MEESEKRRERLKAMRMEASQGDACSEGSSGLNQLSNPLIESVLPVQTNSYATSRFDYYTDPMAAFSNEKRMSKAQNSPGYTNFRTPRNPEMSPSTTHHIQSTYSPGPRTFQPQSPYYGPGPWNPPTMPPSPAHQLQSPFSPDPRIYQARSPYYSSGPRNTGWAPSPAHQAQSIYSPDPRVYQPRAPYFNSGPRHVETTPSPAHQAQFGNFHARGPSHSPNHYGISNFRPSFGGSPCSGPGYGSSPNSERGRGRGRGRERGRGFGGSHKCPSAELRPDLYYDKSMIEDPWKNLKPSIWKCEGVFQKVLRGLDSKKTANLNSNSFGTKKARISGEAQESGCQPSLAEYLAAAFNEAVEEKGNDDALSL